MDFFVSYTQADQAWAEWIAWTLEEDGHQVLVQAWDFVPGTNWTQSMHDGAVVATGDGVRVRTAIGVNQEEESYDLTVRHLNVNGEHIASIVGLENDVFTHRAADDGVDRVRVPKGRYLVNTLVFGTGPDGSPRFGLLSYPGLNLTADTTIELDANAAKPIRVAPPDTTASLELAQVGYEMHLPDRPDAFQAHFVTVDLGGRWTAHFGPPVPAEQLTATINTHWTAGPDFYGLAWFPMGALPSSAPAPAALPSAGRCRSRPPALPRCSSRFSRCRCPASAPSSTTAKAPAGTPRSGWAACPLSSQRCGPSSPAAPTGSGTTSDRSDRLSRRPIRRGHSGMVTPSPCACRCSATHRATPGSPMWT